MEKLVYPPLPKRFNTAGPCDEAAHYMIPPLPRVPEARGLVVQGGYFVLHAPRQSGKTTFLRAFARQITSEGQYAALYLSCEAAEAAGDDAVTAQEIITTRLVEEAERQLEAELRPPQWIAPSAPSRLGQFLSHWAQHSPRRLVILFDEIDAVRGQSLIAVLRQLRAGFPDRPDRAPWSVILCGLRDVREYKMASGGDGGRLGTASPFNVKVKSLGLANFTGEEVRALLAQHTAETGQPFEPEGVDRQIELAGGQPWLVNAMAREVVEEMAVTGPITCAHVDDAKERLVLARATHVDSLVSKLSEARVRRVIEPLLAGESAPVDEVFNDDVSYVVDLGLVKSRPLRVANPIYSEVIARVLSAPVQESVVVDPRSFVRPDGQFDLDVLAPGGSPKAA
ncbi:MAG: ATP-binding protein [Deltaproteobacteria bacterium]